MAVAAIELVDETDDLRPGIVGAGKFGVRPLTQRWHEPLE